MPGLMAQIEKALETNVEDIFSHAKSIIQEDIYALNRDHYEGYMWVASLDWHTCLACGNLDGHIFDALPGQEGEDVAPEQPIHPHCRCIIVPVLKGMRDEYTGSPSYRDFLARQKESVQIDILGPSRYAAYKAGTPIDRFVKIDLYAGAGKVAKVVKLEESGIKRVTRIDLVKDKLNDFGVLEQKDHIKEIQEKSDSFYSTITPEQKQSIDGYTVIDHNKINSTLYGKRKMTGPVREAITNIDNAMDSFMLDKDITVFSGTNAKHYKKWKAGSIYNLDAYLSTSITQKEARWFYDYEKEHNHEPLMIRILVSKGTRGIYIGDNTAFDRKEDEFLLGRGLKYKVLAKTKTTLILEVVK
jgi:hypothetical protein